jgi:hypothetical protein
MASPITTYATLVSAIQEAAEDTGTELLDYLPAAIDLAENKLSRELDFLGLTYTSTVVVSASTATFSKPNDHKVTYSLTYVDPTTSRKTVLEKKTDDYLDEYWPQETSVGTPVYYAEDDRSNFRIAPCVSTAASVKVKGMRRPTALTSANTTNVFTSACPDALFHATMLEVARWQRNNNLLEVHTRAYVEVRDGILNEGRRQRRDDGSPVGNTGGQNTLVQGQG